MSSPHRFLSNDRNAAAMATINASSVLPAEATAFPLPIARQGTARAILTGGYVGANDATLDIEIVSADGDGLLSAPVRTGAGNGVLSDLAASGVPAQTFTVLLASTGTATKAAAIEFYGVKLRAKASGAAGNGIEIAVDESGISASPTVYSFLEDVSAGDSEFSGPQWDFGAYALTADGEIDSRTARLRFGHDPQVYRQYKTYTDNDWRYVIDPPLVRDLPAETPVYALTGAYVVAVTQDATVETYAAIVTLFDLLNAFKTRSNLLDVEGVVVEDRTPGGMAAEDLPLRTSAYALPSTYAGNAAFPGLGVVVVPTEAPTEIITLTCADISTLGGESWTVKGSVSGKLPDSTTGVPYTANDYGWTIPKVLPADEAPAPTGKITVKDIVLVSRQDDDPGIELCVDPVVAGAKAKAKTIEVVYTAVPQNDCPCADAPVTGTLNEKCLGVKIDGATTMAIAAAYQAKLETLYARRASFVASNTVVTASGELRAAQFDLQLVDIGVEKLAQCLADLFGASATPPSAALTAWDAAMTGFDGDLTLLEGIDAEELTSIAIQMENDATYGIPITEGVPTEGQIIIALAGDKTLRRYACLKIETVSGGGGTTSRYYYLPKHYDRRIEKRALVDSGNLVTGSALWQDLGAVASGNADINATESAAAQPGISRDPVIFAARYQAKMDHVRALAGIVPKSEAGSDGSDCWQPCDGEFEWRVNGLEYLPACTNVPYHSSIRTTDANGNKSVVSTQEFGFIIRCACPDRLLPGDRFTIVIENDAAPVKTYEVGDTIKTPVIAAAPLELAGGVDGDDTLVWTVRGSLGAAWPDYAAPVGSEPLYDEDGLQFRIRQGGVPFVLGDTFVFAVAGGTFRWRLDGGAWSIDTMIDVGPMALADGLSLTMQPGPAPAFVAGDAWGFDVRQPHAPALALTPARGAWRWEGAGADWTATFPADTAISGVALWHDCPAGAIFSAQGLSSADAVLWTKSVSYRAGLAVALFEDAEAVADCRKIRLTVASATGGSIKWLWCGTPWVPNHALATITLRASWMMSRGLRAARLTGRGAAGEIAWSVDGKAWLESEDCVVLLALLDELKAQNDMPFVFVPNAAVDSEARLVRIGTDDVDFEDWNQFQYSPRRALDVRLPLSAVPL